MNNILILSRFSGKCAHVLSNWLERMQVVKRAVGVSEDGYTNGMTIVGRKRSASARYGGGSDDGNQHYYKRYVYISLPIMECYPV